jgi:hypothetical protein
MKILAVLCFSLALSFLSTTEAALKNAVGTYNYVDLLGKCFLFYEGQRSGKLPANNRIFWRADSALQDKGFNGEDLTGGWYDAGDHVKFGFPMAYSTTVLAWGILEYRTALENVSQIDYAMDNIKWTADYFVKCHVSDNQLYVQVGDPGPDHAYWGRPENMTMPRPAQLISASKPGGDVAAETAAALAATAMVFQSKDAAYSTKLLGHARKLYSFAKAYPAVFTGAAGFYTSTSSQDEIAWAALWLYRATGEAAYLTDAQSFRPSDFGWGFSWDEKTAGINVLMAKVTNTRNTAAEQYLNSWMPGSGMTYTPGGLAWRLQWASNRYAANTAFLAFVYSDLLYSQGSANNQMANKYFEFAVNQIHYMLGDHGSSFVVGFGVNPPTHEHHRAASCPTDMKIACGQSAFTASTSNPNVLFGALVGGPDQSDGYTDLRTDYQRNEVACDYNAAFTGAVAKLVGLVRGVTPVPPVTVSSSSSSSSSFSSSSSGSSSSGGVPTTCSATTAKSIYTDSLQNSWEHWGWGSGTQLVQSQVARSGSAIAITPTNNEAVYLHCGGGGSCIDLTQYNAISLWVNGGQQGGQKMQVSVYETSNIVGNPSAQPFSAFMQPTSIPANTWVKMTIPFSSFGITSGMLGGFILQDAKGSSQPTIYFDDIQLVCTSPAAQSSSTTAQATTAQATTAQATTARPTTGVATTAQPTTAKPTTAQPTTAKPTTGVATTAQPTTAKPTTGVATTAKSTTAVPTTAKATTGVATTAQPTTAKPTTAYPTTVAATSATTTGKSTTVVATTATTPLPGSCGNVPFVVFSDSLQGNWQAEQSDSAVNIQAQVAKSGVALSFLPSGGSNLSFTCTNDNGDGCVSPSSYNGLAFWVNGGAQGNQNVYLALLNSAGTPVGNPSKRPLTDFLQAHKITSTWSRVIVPFSNFGIPSGGQALSGFALLDGGSSGQTTMYVDDISVVCVSYSGVIYGDKNQVDFSSSYSSNSVGESIVSAAHSMVAMTVPTTAIFASFASILSILLSYL